MRRAPPGAKRRRVDTNVENSTSRDRDEMEAARWLLRLGDDSWSDADQMALDRWLDAAPGHRVSFIRLEAIWTEANRLRSLGAGLPRGQVPPRGAIRRSPFFSLRRAEADSDAAIREVASPPKRRVRAFAVAASALLAFAAGMVVYHASVVSPETTYTTSIGGLSTVPLPDGSVITLNTDSAIQVRFTGRERLIWLVRGEAFFEVARDPARPFAVYAHDRRVVALGTKFSVRLDAEEVHVAVTEGKVGVQQRPIPFLPESLRPQKSAASVLIAGTVANVRERAVRTQSAAIEKIEQGLSWRVGYIVLDRTPLAAAVDEFNRYNTRQLEIADPALRAMEIEGKFRSNNLDGFVRLLEQGFPVAVTERDGRIVLRRK
jgi:transmembrane sensor